MKYFLAGLIFLTCLSASPSENYQDAVAILDSALAEMYMQPSDIWLPWDSVTDDAHRLPLIKELFDTPLQSVDVTREWALASQSDMNGLLRQIAWELSARRDSSLFLSQSEALNQAGDKFKRSVRKHLPDQIRRIANAVALTGEQLNAAVASLDTADFNLVYQQVDSLLMMSEESGDLSIWELKEREIEGRAESKAIYSSAANIDLEPLFHPALDLYDFIAGILDSLTVPDEVRSQSFKTELGNIFIGGTGNDVYREDYAVIIDFGGDDTYLFPEITKDDAAAKPVRCLIDIDGNDRYLGSSYSLAGAVFGVSLLFDRSGNDLYSSDDFSQGSALFGLAVLEDFQGHDSYTSGLCTQGSAAFGIGILIDHQGTDFYQSNAQAQGFGFTRGFGGLIDIQGNDVYVTTSPYQDFLRYESHFVAFTQGAGLGHRPIASGGFGMLFDHHGNDVYQSDIYGQATAYWYALGAIWDHQGDDRYVAFQYAQGAGVHMAHGVLLDDSGNDHYFSHGVSQGCGHDIATGLLFDMAGDDDYTAESLSMGGGNADAISILVDKTGDDTYMARQLSSMMGYSDFRRDYGMIGVFADGGGKDQYGSLDRNDEISTKSTFGVFSDFSLFPKIETASDEPLLTPPDSLKIPLASTVDSLFIQASTAPQKFQYNVKPARELIIEQGANALEFLASKLNTESARERHALVDILKKMLDGPDSLACRKMLVDSLLSADNSSVGMAAKVTGDKRVTDAVPNLTKILSHSDWRMRAMAALYLGKIGKDSSVNTLLPLLSDSHIHVRMRAAYSVGRIQPDSISSFVPLVFSDSSQLVRNSYIQGLIRSKKDIPMSAVVRILSRTAGTEKNMLLDLLPHTAESEEAGEILREFLKYQPPELTKTVHDLLTGSRNEFWKEQAGSLLREPEQPAAD